MKIEGGGNDTGDDDDSGEGEGGGRGRGGGGEKMMEGRRDLLVMKERR